MRANKHQFGKPITPASATNGAQRTARLPSRRDYGVAAVLVSRTETSGTGV